MLKFVRAIALSVAFFGPLEARPSQAAFAVPTHPAGGWEITEPESSGFDAAALCAVFDEVSLGNVPELDLTVVITAGPTTIPRSPARSVNYSGRSLQR